VTITTLRPVAELVKSHALNVVGAANSVAAVTDNSDTSYIQAQVANQYVRFSLGDITVTATQRVTFAQIRIRNACTAGPVLGNEDTLTSLVMGTGNSPVSAAGFLSSRGSATIFTLSGPVAYQSASFVDRTWTQNTVNQANLEIKWYQVHAGTLNMFQRVYELYVDVDINEQPTITGAPTVTNVTNNANPNVAWVYADLDDDPQTAWQVRIFDSNMTGSAGFDPATAVPTWDSGIQSGNASNVDVATPLLNGGNYTAYVRVAQDWPGPQGNLWWSAWATQTFTITFIPPYAPIILSSQVLADNNQYRAQLNVLVPVNLITVDNATFDSSVGQWVALANCAVVRDTTQHADGVASLKMTSTAGGDMTAQCGLDFLLNPHVDGGQTYTLVAQFRTAVSARSCAVGVQWMDSASANLGAIVYGGNVTDSAANFNAQASLTAVAPTGARFAKITVKVVGTGAGAEVHWVDKVDMHAGSTVGWMPGGYRNDQGDLLLERGEYLVDTRGPADNWFHPQVASAGSLVRNAGYGFFIDSTTGFLAWRWLDKTIPAPGNTPPGMLDWSPGITALPVLLFGYWFYYGTAFMAPALAGQVHVFSVWAWVSTGTQVITPRIDWRDSAGGLISFTAGANVTLTTTPQQVVVTGTAPGGTLLATGEIVNVNNDVDRHFYFTRAGFGLGSTPVDGRQAMGAAAGITPGVLPTSVGWAPIRFADDGENMGAQAFLPGFAPGYTRGQVESFADYEYVPGRPTLYRASIAYTANGVSIRSPYSAQVMVYAAPPPVTLLRSCVNPLLQVAVNRRKDMTLTRADDAAVFHPLGADAAPIRVRDWASGDDGTLTVITSTDAQHARLHDVVTCGDVMQIQWAQGGRTYCTITDLRVSETMSSDIGFCDVDGKQDWLRYSVWQLTYVQTVAP
jgi:hypothetical protein